MDSDHAQPTQAEKYAREDKEAPNATALKVQMLAQTGATSYEDEVRRNALKRKRGEERSVQVTPEDAPPSGTVEVTVWSSRLYLSIVTSKRSTSIAEFVKRDDGSPGEVEATGRVAVGDIITHINGHIMHGLASSAVSEMIRSSSRPLVISFKKRELQSETRASPSQEHVEQAAAPASSPAQPSATQSSSTDSPPSQTPSIATTSIITPSPVVTVPSTTAYPTTQSSTVVGNMQFAHQPPQPAFGAPHPSMRATSSSSQQEYAAAVRANPWNRTYSSTAQQMRAGPMPAYGMQVPMNPQQPSVATTSTHYNQHPRASNTTTSYARYQPYPADASMPTQQFIQHPYTTATSMISAYSSQQANSVPQSQRTYSHSPNYDAQVSAAGNANYTARQSSSSTLGVRIQQTHSALRPSDSAHVINNSHRESSPSSSPPMKRENHRNGREEDSNSTVSTDKRRRVGVQSEEPQQQQADTQDDDGNEGDEPSYMEDRTSYELDGTNSADELAVVLGEKSSDPLAESSLSPSSATAGANVVEEMSFLKPNKPSFVTRLPGAIESRPPQHQSFQHLQQLPRSTSRFGLFNGEECVVVLIQRPRLQVTLSPLGSHISISSFARDSNGEAGEIEESGKVFVGDIIVGVNGMRLNPELSPTDLGRLLVSLVRPFEIYFKRASWEALEGGIN